MTQQHKEDRKDNGCPLSLQPFFFFISLPQFFQKIEQ